MASITIHRQSLARRRSDADNRLRGPIGTKPRPAQRVHADLAVDNVHNIDASNGTLADQRIEARVAAVLSEVEHIKTRTRSVYFAVSNGRVALYGAVHDNSAAREIEEAVRTNAGIDTVQNHIYTIGACSGE